MSSLFKRTKNPMRANVSHNDTVAPSIRSVVEMRQHLEQKYASVQEEHNRTKAKINDYSTLISSWTQRASAVEPIVRKAETVIRNHENGKKISTEDYAKAGEVLAGFNILFETATEYAQVYRLAVEKAKKKQLHQEANLKKMVDTLYHLQSFERNYSLKASLHKVSVEISSTSSVDTDVQETREINRILHTAEALLELKEEDYGFSMPALPSI